MSEVAMRRGHTYFAWLIVLTSASRLADAARTASGSRTTSSRSSSSTPLSACQISQSLQACSHCPSASWQDAARSVLLRDERTRFFLINIGANKGYNANEFLARYQRGWKATNQNWGQYLALNLGISHNYSCGACRACHAWSPPRVDLMSASTRVLAVELNPANVDTLRASFAKFRVPGTIVHAGCSNVSGSAVFATRGLEAGAETARLGEQLDETPTQLPASAARKHNSSKSRRIGTFESRQQARREARREAREYTREALHASARPPPPPTTTGTMIAMRTVDDLVSNSSNGVLGLSELSARDHTSAVGVLSIDTEGHDALVLEGARGLLARHAVQIVEFEYHFLPLWTERALHSTVAWLNELDYACFWQSNSGLLAPVLPGCSYVALWSNVVCVYKGVPGLEAAMRALVPQSSEEIDANQAKARRRKECSHRPAGGKVDYTGRKIS